MYTQLSASHCFRSCRKVWGTPWTSELCRCGLGHCSLVNLHNYWRSPFLMANLTISMAIVKFANCWHNQRVLLGDFAGPLSMNFGWSDLLHRSLIDLGFHTPLWQELLLRASAGETKVTRWTRNVQIFKHQRDILQGWDRKCRSNTGIVMHYP